MKIFFDTEFLDLGETVQLVSLGAVREDGAEFYAESSQVDWTLASNWVLANVRVHLSNGNPLPLYMIMSAFSQFAADVTEFWAYYGAYDWFLICRLFDGFMNLPARWPHYFHDLQTLKLLRGYQGEFPQQIGVAHHALLDARWNRDIYNFLMRTEVAP